MSKRALLAALLPAVLLAETAPAHAARPFVTDDARIVESGGCQLESWLKLNRNNNEFWALPGCNFTGNLELTAGVGTARNRQGEHSSDYVIQAKTQLKPLETNGYGLALAAGKIFHPGSLEGPNQLGNSYVYAPLSFSLNDDRLFVYTSLGWLRDRATRRDNLTWGAGTELVLSRRINFVLETYGDNRASPYWQIGLRTFIVPDRWQIDLTAGNQAGAGAEGRWLSLGLRFTPGQLF